VDNLRTHRHPSSIICMSAEESAGKDNGLRTDRRRSRRGEPVGTAVRTPEVSRPSAEPGSAPAARRVRPPRWLDLRLVLGVLLVLGSVLLGARVIGAADATVPVWSVTGDLAQGTVLSTDDLAAVDVRLDAAAAGYLSTTVDPVGRTLARAVGARELLPSGALEETTDLVQVALPVQAGWVPPSLRRGQLVDVYAVADPAAGAAGVADGTVGLVVAGAPVQSVTGRTEGVLSTPTTTVQVVVSVPSGSAPDLLASVGGRPLVVVVHEDAGGSAGPPIVGEPAAARPPAAGE
jgi:hypothetical protein